MDNLIEAFIIAEAKEYNSVKDINWIKEASKMLLDAINKIDGNIYSYVKIYNRTGVDSHSILLELLLPQTKSDSLKTYNIFICDCGELNHLIQ